MGRQMCLDAQSATRRTVQHESSATYYYTLSPAA
jgi:hypothetical protein